MGLLEHFRARYVGSRGGPDDPVESLGADVYAGVSAERETVQDEVRT
jgi:hypothetical protein